MLEQRLNGTMERMKLVEENMSEEKSSEEVMTNNVLKRSLTEEAQKNVLQKVMKILKKIQKLVMIKSSIVNIR